MVADMRRVCESMLQTLARPGAQVLDLGDTLSTPGRVFHPSGTVRMGHDDMVSFVDARSSQCSASANARSV